MNIKEESTTPLEKKNILLLAPYNDNSNDHFFINELAKNDKIKKLSCIQLTQSQIRDSSFFHTYLKDMIFSSNDDKRLITLSDNNIISSSVINQWITFKKNTQKRYAVLHFDNHPNMGSIGNGLIDSKNWVSPIIDMLNKPSDLIQVGLQPKFLTDSTSAETNQYSSDSIFQNINHVTESILDYLKTEKIDELYISLDLSVLDSHYYGANPKSDARGLEPHQISYIINSISIDFKISAADICEIHLMPHYKNTFLLNPEPQTTKINTDFLVHMLEEAVLRWQ
jgi:arginase family enzyme